MNGVRHQDDFTNNPNPAPLLPDGCSGAVTSYLTLVNLRCSSGGMEVDAKGSTSKDFAEDCPNKQVFTPEFHTAKMQGRIRRRHRTRIDPVGSSMIYFLRQLLD
jgi:hypothetical protein